MDIYDRFLECRRLYTECKEYFKKPEVVNNVNCMNHRGLHLQYRADYQNLKNERRNEVRGMLVPTLSLPYVKEIERIVYKMVTLAKFCIRFEFARELHRQLNNYLHGPYIDRSALGNQILQMEFIFTELNVVETNVIVANPHLNIMRFDFDMANNVNELLDRLFDISNSLTRMFTWQTFLTKQELFRKEKFFESDFVLI